MSSSPGRPTQPVPPMDPSVRKRKLNFLSWFRAGFGVIAGLTAGFLNFLSLNPPNGNPSAYLGAFVGVFLYLISYWIARYMMDLSFPAPSDKNKLVTQGIGAYAMLFLFTWFLYNTLCFVPGFPCYHM